MGRIPKEMEKFRDLLNANFQFPTVYLHKFIGNNSAIFAAGVSDFEKKFIGLKRVTERQSASGKHLALTYEYQAASAEDVVELAIQTHRIHDLIYIL